MTYAIARPIFNLDAYLLLIIMTCVCHKSIFIEIDTKNVYQTSSFVAI